MIFKRKNTNQEENYLFTGLGNPGPEYELTRHNIGFMVIDRLAVKWDSPVRKYKDQALYGIHKTKSYRAILIKPQNYMNRSGRAVRSFANFYKVPDSQIMVIFDDLDLPFGEIRIRESGGSSGQKGMESILQSLGTQDFPRMRIGIGRPPGKKDPADFILDQFKPKERKSLDLLVGTCAEAIETFLDNGIDQAMTRYNRSIFENEKD